MRVPLIGVVVFAACSVDLPDLPGLACDDTHPCEAGRDCVAGFCRDESAGGGTGGGSAGGVAGGGSAGGATTGGGGATGGGAGSGGGTAGGGAAGGGMAGGGGGGGMVVDAGRVVWRQVVDGFTGESSAGSATCDIRLDAGNQVVSTVFNDTVDLASGDQRDAGFMPHTGNGRLKGKFRLPAALALKGNSAFLRLEKQGNDIVLLRFTPQGYLELRSDPGLVSSGGLTQQLIWPGGFSAGTDYTVDIGWKRGQYRTFVVNGVDAGMIGATDPGGAVQVPDVLHVGIYGYDGDGGIDAGWSIIMTDWQMADDPAVPL